MVQSAKKSKKAQVVALRRRGLSYSDIKAITAVSKSTLSYWLKGIPISKQKTLKLKKRQLRATRKAADKRSELTRTAIEAIQKKSASDIREISKRELWLMGIMLYWRERSSSDLAKGVRFASSDATLIKIFIKWLRDIGSLENDEFYFDIIINRMHKRRIRSVIKHWAGITGFKKESFNHVYYIGKAGDGSKPAKETDKEENGILRIRIKSSSMLARQISGWTLGIKNLLL